MKRVAAVIVNYRTPELTVACVKSLISARDAFEDFKIIVVDGGSGDASADSIAKAITELRLEDWVFLLPLPVNGGFAFANNRAMMMLAEQGPLPDYIALINPDTRVMPQAMERLASLLDTKPEAGAVGALLIGEDGAAQGSAFEFPCVRGEFCRGARTGLFNRLLRQPTQHIEAQEACEVPWVTGAAVMLRTEALRSTGLFDEGFFLYFEETELMWRLRKAGWHIWHQPEAQVFHAGGAATQIRDPKTGLVLPKRMPRYWYEARRRYFALVGGPAYALAAGLAWIAGHCVWTIRRTLARKPADGTLRPLADLASFGLWPGKQVAKAAILRFSGPCPATPAWMEPAE